MKRACGPLPGLWASLRWACATIAAASACEGSSTPPAPVLGATQGDSGGGGLDSAAGNGGGGGPTQGVPPDPCVLLADDPEPIDPGSESSNEIRFDVAVPDLGGGFSVTCDDVQATATNLGCEFWAVDLPNDYRGTTMSPPAADQQFAIVVANASALSEATVRIYEGDGTDVVDAATIPRGETFTFELDPLSISAEVSSDNGVAYRVSSDVPVTAYQFNPLDNTLEVYSNDASLLFPTHSLGQQYTVTSGDAILLGTGPSDPSPVNAGAFVSVVGEQDNTIVEFRATASVIGGSGTVTIDRGQVATLLSDGTTANGNLSGTRVLSDKPVAVFAGNVATSTPTGGTGCCADHLEHQLLPAEAWGSTYAVAPPPGPGGTNDMAEYRLVGAFDGTTLEYCPIPPPGAPTELQAGQTVTFSTDLPFAVRTDADHPFSVTQFLLSNEALGANRLGDPAMLVVPAAAQAQRQFVFVVPAGYDSNWVTIVTGATGQVTLDGATVPDGEFAHLGTLPGGERRFVHLPIELGAHTIEATTDVAISVVGYDEAVSYAYPGGSGLRVISIPPAEG